MIPIKFGTRSVNESLWVDAQPFANGEDPYAIQMTVPLHLELPGVAVLLARFDGNGIAVTVWWKTIPTIDHFPDQYKLDVAFDTPLFSMDIMEHIEQMNRMGLCDVKTVIDILHVKKVVI